MSDLIDRQALLKQIDIDSDGEPGYYGDTWKFIDTIKRMPSALGTNLAEVGTDCISRQAAIDAIEKHIDTFDAIDTNYLDGLRTAMNLLHELPSAQPEPSWDCEKCMMEHTDEMEKLEAELAMAQPKRGKWVYQIGMIKCDQCLRAIRRIDHDGLLNFCPNCGADMRGEHDE